MNLQQINLKQIMPTVLFFGIIGGLLQILITILPIKVWWILSVYPIVIILNLLNSLTLMDEDSSIDYYLATILLN